MIVCLFEWKQIGARFLSFVHTCIAVEDPIIRAEDWEPINQFNHDTFLCLSQARTWISNVIIVFFMLGERWMFVLLISVELLTILFKLSVHTCCKSSIYTFLIQSNLVEVEETSDCSSN